jgi:hypothetical protein
LTNSVREKVDIVVSRAFDRYGNFTPDFDRLKFYEICTELVLNVSDLIDRGSIPSAKLLKNDIIRSLYTLGFNINRAETVISYVFEEAEKEASGIREYRNYSELITSAIRDYKSLFKTGIVEYLNGFEEYGISSLITNKKRKEFFPVRKTFENSRLKSKFSAIFKEKLFQNANIITKAAFDINNVTSDSNVQEFDIPDDIDIDLLTATFFGGGKKIYQDVVNLVNVSNDFGGYEGSFANTVEYQSQYYGYVMAMCYGRKTEYLNEEFGDFEKVFEQRSLKNNEIAGLKFLEPLYRNKSGIGTNPLVDKFADGVKDRYIGNVSDSKDIDIIELTLEAIYVACLKVGGSIYDKSSLQMEILSKVFPPSYEIYKIGKGITGGMYTLLTGHRSISELLGGKDLPDYQVIESFESLKQNIDSLIDSFKTTGFKPGGYVPSMELNYHEPRKSLVRDRVKSLGFTESEVEVIMSANNFSELLNSLAPLTDSNDIISFFRAYDLTKLIYEFGGQESIEQFTDFLYGKDDPQSLIRLLEFLNVNRSQRSIIAGSKYSKLISYLISLTYAVDPEKLQIFNEFLGDNNLNLLKSVSLLLERGINTVVLSRDKVSLLSGVVAQMVVSDNSGYENQKPAWNALIEQSAGNVGVGVKGMYNEREGITPTELYSILNNPSATSPLGSILNGVRGGRLTSILKYCNIFGLLYSLSDYRNSYQLINEPAEKYKKLLELVARLEELSQSLELGILVLNSEEGFGSDFTNPLIKAQGKIFDSIVDIVKGGDGSQFPLAEPPGIGNSRTPNGVRIDNSLTPEESSALVVSTGTRSSQSFSLDSGSYIRISMSNLLSQGVILDGEKTSEPSNVSVNQPGSDSTFVDTVYTRGGSIIRASSKFDPVSFCRKFGGQDCDTLGTDKCEGNGYNKSFYPETGYGTESPIPGILIDRPLGSSLKIETIPNSIARGDTNYYYSIQGITELSKSSVFKDNEMLCSSIKDPFEYSACISMLKCKRFDPPYRGKYFFKFCPRSLFGGRLAP